MFHETAEIIHDLLPTVATFKELCKKIGRENFWNYLDYVQFHWYDLPKNVFANIINLLSVKNADKLFFKPVGSYRFELYDGGNYVGYCYLNAGDDYVFKPML